MSYDLLESGTTTHPQPGARPTPAPCGLRRPHRRPRRARSFYDDRRTAGDTHHRALRALANRLVGIFHGCLRHSEIYDEDTVWRHRSQLAA